MHDGFRGSIHATAGTAELATIVLLDAARLQQEDAAYANRVGSSRHHPAQPLYTAEDAEQTIERFVVHAFAEQFEPTDDVRVTLHRAGHILGAAWASVTAEGMDELAFSGDLGRPDHPLLLPPDPLTTVGSLVVESTYGNRLHDASARGAGEVLGDVISRTAARGGSVLIPSFAVDRTEVVLYELKRLMDAGDIPALPVYIDSPMALAALRVYRRALDEGWAEIRPELHGREDIFDTGRLNEVRTVAESKSLNDVRFPSIIIAGSGMATGGRILHHLSARLADPRNAVVFVGHQVQGTRGRLLVDGAREIKIFGDYIDVRSEIVDLGGFSVHADAKEVVAWIGTAPKAPRTCFVVHGELDAAEALCGDIRREFASQTIVPKHDEIIHVRQPSR